MAAMPFIGYYAGTSLALLFFGIQEWRRKREEEGLFHVLADVARTFNRDCWWPNSLGLSKT